jgi:hypothetical protein
MAKPPPCALGARCPAQQIAEAQSSAADRPVRISRPPKPVEIFPVRIIVSLRTQGRRSPRKSIHNAMIFLVLAPKSMART